MKKKFLLILLSFLLIGCSYSLEDIITTKKPCDKKNFCGSGIDFEGFEEIIPQENFSEDINLYPLDHIIDGDTYIVVIDGKKEKVRVLGIDTPEKEGGFRVEGCFGNDASEYVTEQLKGKKVSLLKPKQQAETDKYGRLLRYVFVDGKDFGGHLIEEGYASSFKKFPHERQKYYTQLEKTAQKNKKGMWNPKNCEYWGQEN